MGARAAYPETRRGALPRHPARPTYQVVNVAVDELKEALRNTNEIVLSVTGRKSGREISNPVWFVLEGDTLYLLPIIGTDSHWYRNVLKTPTVRIVADGVEATLEARPITDPAKVAEVIERFRAKYGADQVERYYPNPNVAVEVPLA
jgi:deazaflavin-dependent oxidoreductase (nitroreductase family)